MTIGEDVLTTPTTRRRWLVLIAVVAVVLLVSLVPWGWSRVVTSCRAAEEDDYAALEQLASRTLREVGAELARDSGCADTGQPGASVRARVSGWGDRRDAASFLEQAGWSLISPPNVWLSPDRTGVAQVVTVDEPAEGTYVEVSFSDAE